MLTEYEEHRLRENIKNGRSLYRIHAAFDLMTIDKGLDELKGRLKPIGEVITYLPSAEAANDQQIELDSSSARRRSCARCRRRSSAPARSWRCCRDETPSAAADGAGTRPATRDRRGDREARAGERDRRAAGEPKRDATRTS